LTYSSSLKVQELVKKITASNFYCQIAKKRIKKQKERDKDGPFNLVIETTNFCNAKCLMCPHQVMKRPKKIMDRRTFNKIVARIKREGPPINKVFFSGMGEPLTDPNLIFRIKVMKKMGFPVRLYTNASLLSPEISRQLVDLKVDEINISFNGTTPVQYKKIMSLNFKRTASNIDTLIKIKKKNLSSKPFVQISSIVVEENRGSIRKHIDNWKSRADSVTVSLAHEWGGGVKTSLKSEGQSLKLVYPCRSLWHTFVIDSQGNFVVCCRDYESKYVLGNIYTHSFADIQKSETLKRFRRLHLKYLQEKLPKMCQKCNFPYQSGIEWFLLRSID